MNFSLNTDPTGTVRQRYSGQPESIHVRGFAMLYQVVAIIRILIVRIIRAKQLILLFLLIVNGVYDGYAQTPSAGDYRSVNSGNWSDLACWERFDGNNWSTPTVQGYPGQNAGTHDVTIQAGNTITIDTDIVNSPVSTLSVNGAGILQYESSTARTLTVSEMVRINQGGIFRSALSGTVTTHQLVVEGSLINNGTINFSTTAGDLGTTANAAGAGITFTGSSNALFDLSGATLTNLRQSNGLLLNKGTTASSVLSFTPGGTFQVLSANTVGFLTIQSGTFSLMGENAFLNPLFYASTGSYTVPSGGGFRLDNPNATISGIYGTLTNNGEVIVRDGVFNIGDGSGNESLTTSTGRFELSGGTMNISGRFRIDGGNCIISGGTLNLATIGHADRTLAAFHISESASLTISSNPLITFAFPNSNVTPFNDIEIVAGTGIKTITGGTFQMGTTVTPSTRPFYINSDIPIHNLTVYTANTRVVLSDHLTINNLLTLNGRLSLINYNLNLGAPAISGDLRASHGMILTGTGQIQKTINSTGSYVFPFGNSSNAYLPVTLNFTGGSFSLGATVSVGMTPSIHPRNVNTTNYLRRYWTVRTTGITNPVYNFTGTYATADIAGSDSYMTTGVYTTAWRKLSASGNIGTTIFASGLTEDADISGITAAAPGLTVTPATAIICSGLSVQLTATATGDGPFNYSWAPATGLSAANISNPVASPTATTPYTVRVTDGMGGVVTANATVTVNPLPTATISGTTDVCQNENAPNITFTGAAGTAPYTFTYRINNGADQTVTSTGNIATVAVSTSTAGEFVYTLVSVQDAHCTQLQTGAATVTINPLPTVTVSSNSPQCTGSRLDLFAAGGITYSWTGPNNFTSTQQNPSIATVTTAAAGTYTVTVTNANGCIATASTSVTINPAPSVSITANPGNTICSGTNVTFTPRVSNAGTNYTYQWKINGVDVTGATGPSFSTTTLANAQQVTVVVTADPAYCSSQATSNIITMTVNDPATPTVNILESGNNICAGTPVTFTSVVANGGTAPTYQWQINEVNVPGATNASFSSTTLSDDDRVRVIIQSNATCVTSSSATSNTVNMQVNPVVTPSVILSANPSTAVCPGTSITFTASPTHGGSNPVYQWRVNNTVVGTNSPTFTSSTLANNDVVSVSMTSNATCVSQTNAQSNNVTVIVNPGTPAIPAAITGNIVACPNGTETYTIAQVTNATSYTWNVPSGWQIVNGQGTNTITYTTGNSGQNGNITVTAENNCGTSSPRTLAISVGSPSTAPTAITVSNNNTCFGTSKTLSVTGGSLGTGAQWQWYGGSCGGTLVGYGATLTINPTGTTIYYVRASGTCNTTTCASETVIVSPGAPAQPEPIAGGVTPICPGTSLTYNIPAVNDATSYNWTVPTGWTITAGQGTTSITVTAGTAGQNGNILVTAVNSCGTSTARTLAVTVAPGAPATPGFITGNSDVCVNSTGRVYSVAVVPNATTYTWTPPSGWTITSGQGTSSITVSTNGTASSGSISVVAGNNCGTSAASVLPVYIVTSVPATPGAINGLTAICPVKSVVYSITPVQGAISYSWTVPNNWSISAGQGSSSITAQVPSNAASGNVTVTANNICGASSASILSVTVANTAWVNAGSDRVVCQGTPSVTLNGSVGGAIKENQANEWDWVVSTGNIVNGNSLTSVYQLPNNGNTPGVYTVRIRSNVNAVGCNHTEDEMTVTVMPTPNASLAITGNNPICVGASSTVTFTANPNTTVTYTVLGIPGSSTINIGASGTATLTTPVLLASTTYTLTNIAYTIVPACSRVILGSATITVSPVATVNAGSDLTICTGTSATMAGSFGGSATSALWTSSGSGTFSNNTPTAVYTPSVADIIAGAVTLTYTTNDPTGPCNAVSDAMTLTINPVATIHAGEDQTICVGSTVTMAGSFGGSATSGTWSGGTGTFNNNTPTAVYTPSVADITAGTVTLTFTSNDPDGPCPAVSDAMVLTINPLAIVNAGVDQSVCATSTISLTGTVSGPVSTGTWSGGSGSFSNPSSLNTVYTPSAEELSDGRVTLTLTSADPDGPCEIVSDQITITITPPATVNAGVDQSVCDGDAINLRGSMGGAATAVTWSGGTGSFSNPNSINTTYTRGATETGVVVLTLTTNDPTGSCDAVSDQMQVTIHPPATVNAGNSQTICSNGTAQLSGSIGGSATTGTWTTSGGGTFSDNTSPTAVYTPGNSDIFNGTVTLTYTTNDPEGPCPPASTTMTLIISDAIQITSQPSNTGVCATYPADLSVQAIGDNLSYQWYRGTAPGGTVVVNSTNITGAQSAALHFNHATSTDEGSYYLLVSGAVNCTTLTSAVVTLNVDQEITITTPLQANTVCVGEDVTFSIVAEPGGLLTFQWRKDGEILSGETGNTLTLNDVTLANGGSYDVLIAGLEGYTCSNAQSAAATLTVTPSVETPVFALGASSTRCQGTGNVTYSATANHSTEVTYHLDAASLAGGNSINAATGVVTYVAGWSGTTIITASAAGCNGPATAIHTVTITPTVTIVPFAELTSTRCQGAGSVTYSTTAANSTGITYTLDNASVTGGNTINAFTGEVTFTATWAGPATITASAAGCNGPVTATHTVTVTPTVTINAYSPLTSTRCQGAGLVTYSTTAANSTGITYSLDAASLNGDNSINASTGEVTFAAGWVGDIIITASAAGCNGPAVATHTVTVSPTVSIAPFVSTTSTRCQRAETITYSTTATHSTGITYSLDPTTAAFTGNSINASTGAVTYATGWSGTTTITASAAGCNGPAVATHTITVTPSVTIAPYTTLTSTRCQGAGTVTYATTANNYSSAIVYSLDAASLTGGNVMNASTGEVTYAAGWSGTTTITASAEGCNGPVTTTHIVTVTPTVTIMPFAALTSTRCQGAGSVTYSTTATHSTGITYSLDAASITGGNTINASTGAVTFAAGWSGPTTITASAAGCNGPATATLAVYTDPTSVGGILSPYNNTVCTTSNSGSLTLSVETGTILRWESSTNAGVSWTQIPHTANVYNFSNLPLTTIFRAVVKSGACPEVYSAPARVVVIPLFEPIITATTVDICNGNSTTLSVQTGLLQPVGAFTGGGFNQANPPGWRVSQNGAVISPFPAAGDNRAVGPWAETNGPRTFNGVSYDTQDNTKFTIVNGAINSALETPVFNLFGLPSAELTFNETHNLAPGTTARVELSTDGGNSYNIVLATYTGSTGGIIDNPVDIDMSAYLGMMNLRIRFNYISSAPGGWALDGISIPSQQTDVTYFWSPAETLSSSTDSVVIATPGTTTTYTLTMMVSGCPVIAKSIVIGVANPPVVQTTNACIGAGSVTFTQTGGTLGGIWRVSGGGTISASTGVFTPTVPGCFNASYITPAGTCGDTVNFVVFPAAPIPVVNSACGPIVITPPAAIPGFTLQYSFDNGTTWGGNTPPTADNCAGYQIRTRYITSQICDIIAANTTSTIAGCDISPAVTRVVDLTAPVITCAAEVTASTNADDCFATLVLTPPVVTDNCTAASAILVTSNAPAQFPVGETIVTWTATDACNNQSTCTQTVTITDNNQAPIFTSCPGDQVQTALPNNCALYDIVLTEPVATDNCAVTRVTYTTAGATTLTSPQEGLNYVSGQDLNVGVTTITYIAYDAAGNPSQPCIFDVWIKDLNKPEFTVGCPEDVFQDADAGLCTAAVTVPVPEVTDPCDEGYTLTNDFNDTDNASGIYPVGTTTVIWTITDDSGNIDTCEQKITINDRLPILSCPENVAEVVAADGCSKSDVTIDVPTFVGNCAEPVLSYVLTGSTTGSGLGVVPSSQEFGVGVTRVTYTVTDSHNNIDSCSFTVTIRRLDIPPAVITCPENPAPVNAVAGTCFAPVTVASPVEVDPCATVTYTFINDFNDTNNASDSYPVGTTVVTWTITDNSGNTMTCPQTVVVNDLPPTITCPEPIVAQADFELTYQDEVIVPAPDYDDNCPDPVLTWSLIPPAAYASQYTPGQLSGTDIYPSPSLFYLGVNTITYTVTDANGNTEDCSFTVTILAEPEIACLPGVSYTTDPGVCTATRSSEEFGLPTLVRGLQPINWTWTITNPDNSQGATNTFIGSTATPGPPSIPDYAFEQGISTITWRAENVSGFDECTQTVTVNDNQAPTFSAPSTITRCVESIMWAVYNPNPTIGIVPEYNDLTTPRPEYFLFTTGNTLFDLNIESINFNDNCCADEDLIIHWRIDFTPTPNPATVAHEMVSHASISGTGQPSLYIQNIQFPGDGVTFQDVIHQMTYWLVDCNGIPSDEQSVNIIIQPRPNLTKVTD